MRRQDKELVIDNFKIYQYYKERLINIALAQFEWQNLPETCDRRYFEKTLLFSGTAAMYIPKGMDFWLSTGYLMRGKFDVYGYPKAIYGIGYNAENIATDTWEVLYDNMTRTTLLPMIDLYARQLWMIHNVFNSNMHQQIRPYIITTTQNNTLSFKNIFNRIFGFEPVVQLKDSFDPESIKTLDLRVDFKGKEMLECLKLMWAEALAMLGISAETTKKERLISNEIMINRQEDIISLNARLLNRVDFCNKMNKKYDMDLSVNLSSTSYGFEPYTDAMAQMIDDADRTTDPISETRNGKENENNG